MTLRFLEEHLVLVPLEPRKPGCSVVEGKDLKEEKVKKLADAAEACWNAILGHDLKAFATAYLASFQAQTAMFPGMITPRIYEDQHLKGNCTKLSIQPEIDKYSAMDGVLAWKLSGAGGGGYLALVVEDAKLFCQQHEEGIEISVRRG